MNQSRITLTIRDEDLPEHTTVLLHMGGADSRSIGQKANTVVKYHDYWIGLLDTTGRFAVSVYALTTTDEQAILERMPHTTYGRSTVGKIRTAGFEMLPTTVAPLLNEEIQALQQFHYSILLPIPGAAARLRQDEGSLFIESEALVRPEVSRLIDLFKPMRSNDFAG